MITKKCLYHASPTQGLTSIIPKETKAYPDLGAVVFASSIPGFAACFGTYWSDTAATVTLNHTKDNDYPKEKTVNQVTFELLEPDEVDVESPCSLYIIRGSFVYLEYAKGLEQFTTAVCGVVKETKFKSFHAMLKAYDVKLIGS
jgi:hypothetical protein